MSKTSLYLGHEFSDVAENEEPDSGESLGDIDGSGIILVSVNEEDSIAKMGSEDGENISLEETDYITESDQTAGSKGQCPGRRGPVGTKPCNYICDICGRELTTNGGLKIHKRIHTGETPFVCEVCDRPFARQWSLTSHMKIHTNDRQYVCEQCGKSFKQSGHLTTHVRIHTGEKPFVCPTCEKRFSEGGKLDRHIRTHTGERPYACKICDKRIAQYAGLLRHMRTHTGERPFQCPVCNRRFSQSGDVRRHMKTHRESKISDNMHYGEVQTNEGQPQVIKLLVEDVLKLENEGLNAVSEVYFL